MLTRAFLRTARAATVLPRLTRVAAPVNAGPLRAKAAATDRQFATTAHAKNSDEGTQATSLPPGPVLFAGNLPWKTSTDEVRQIFEKYGPVLKVRIPEDSRGRSRGYALVPFESMEDAKSAFDAMNEAPVIIQGRNVRVEFAIPTLAKNLGEDMAAAGPAPQRVLYVGNLPWKISTDEVRQIFEKYGPVVDVRISEDSSGRSRGTAFVTFETVEDAKSAVDALYEEPVFIQGCSLQANFRTSRAKPTHSLALVNFDGSKEELIDLFGPWLPHIQRIHVAKYLETGEPRRPRLAFVDFINVESASDAVIKLRHALMSKSGKRFTMQYTTSTPMRKRSSGLSRGGM